MKRFALLGAAALIGLLPSFASARSRADFFFGINLGGIGIGVNNGFYHARLGPAFGYTYCAPPVVYSAPPVVYSAPPVYVAPQACAPAPTVYYSQPYYSAPACAPQVVYSPPVYYYSPAAPTFYYGGRVTYFYRR